MAEGHLRRHHTHGFVDRDDAGRALAQMLSRLGGDAPVVLGLARGGVPVAAVVAADLGAPLDVLVVRKLGVPGREELALGAITRSRMFINNRLVADLDVAARDIDAIIDRESRELNRRENAYRQGRPPVDVAGRTVILTDDGVATGASMRVAALAVRDAGADRLVIAVPTGPTSVQDMFVDVADEVVCVQTPRPFIAVGVSYRHFEQVTDATVTAALVG